MFSHYQDIYILDLFKLNKSNKYSSSKMLFFYVIIDSSIILLSAKQSLLSNQHKYGEKWEGLGWHHVHAIPQITGSKQPWEPQTAWQILNPNSASHSEDTSHSLALLVPSFKQKILRVRCQDCKPWTHLKARKHTSKGGNAAKKWQLCHFNQHYVFPEYPVYIKASINTME